MLLVNIIPQELMAIICHYPAGIMVQLPTINNTWKLWQHVHRFDLHVHDVMLNDSSLLLLWAHVHKDLGIIAVLSLPLLTGMAWFSQCLPWTLSPVSQLVSRGWCQGASQLLCPWVNYLRNQTGQAYCRRVRGDVARLRLERSCLLSAGCASL